MKEIIVFGASWCKPCQQLKPTIEKLKEIYSNIEYIDIDSDQEAANLFSVSSVPQIFFVEDSNIIKSFQGVQTYPLLKKEIEKFMK